MTYNESKVLPSLSCNEHEIVQYKSSNEEFKHVLNEYKKMKKSLDYKCRIGSFSKSYLIRASKRGWGHNE